MMAPGQLLVQCLLRDADPGTAEALRHLSQTGWARLVGAAEWHGTGPMLYRALRRHRDVEVPAEAHARLRDLYDHSLVRNLAIDAQLEEVLRALAKAGHSVVVLKGAVLARIAYDDPALRPMYDLDLLSPPGEADALHAYLQTLGYHPVGLGVPFAERHHLHPLGRDDGVSVEIHRALAPIDTPFLQDLSGLWTRSMRTRIGDVDLPYPAPDDMLVHLCVHAACNHELQIPLLTICDIDCLIVRAGDALPWARLIASANDAGVGHFVYVLLRMSEILRQTPIPSGVLASLRHGPADEAMVPVAIDHLLGGSEGLPTMLAEFARARSVGGRVRAIWRGVFPPIAQVRKIYDLPPDSRRALLYYLYRPADLVVRRAGWLFGLLLGGRASAEAVAHDQRQRRVREWSRRRDDGAETTRG